MVHGRGHGYGTARVSLNPRVLWLLLMSILGCLLSSAPAIATSLSNGGSVTGYLATPSSQDTYTFGAGVGEYVEIRIADTGNTSFSPRITLFDPNGAYATYAQGYVVGHISYRATAVGIYRVVVSDAFASSGGSYKIDFAHAPGANEGGLLPNGEELPAALELGDLDSYTYTANAGEYVDIRVSEATDTALIPRITLYDPNGAYVTYAQGYVVGHISHRTALTGTYTLVVSDASNGLSASGAYKLEFVHAPGANEGGVLPNGGELTAALSVGDLDSYTYVANAGEYVDIRVSEATDTALIPRITLYDPNGAYVTYAQGYVVGHISQRTVLTGTYTLVVSDASNGLSASGAYKLEFVHAPGANEGGVLPNGGELTAALSVGDLDSYTYTANAGEYVDIRVSEATDTALIPRITLYDPNGAYVTYAQGYVVGHISHRTALTGTYTLVVSDASNGLSASGAYKLEFVHAPGANEGGVLPNGGELTAALSVGDLDSYTYTASAGEYVDIRVSEATDTALIPRITLYDSNGAYVTYAQGYVVGHISHRSVLTGTYTLVVSDASNGLSASGAYKLEFVHAPVSEQPFHIAAGNQISSNLTVGDLDPYQVNLVQNELVTITITEASATDTSLIPRITLYDPSGAYATYAQGYTVGSISYRATATGVYTLVVSDASSGLASSGPYHLALQH